MLARVYSCAVVGLDGVVVEVEVDLAGTAQIAPNHLAEALQYRARTAIFQ